MTIIDGFKIAKSPAFVVVEFVLCITITIDFAFKARMAGCAKYLTMNHWNKFDLVIVIGCNILFIISVISTSKSVGEEVTEEILFIAWCCV